MFGLVGATIKQNKFSFSEILEWLHTGVGKGVVGVDQSKGIH